MQASLQLVIGGQRSGKSRHAERLGQAWLRADGQRCVTVLATALPTDDEMRLRIERHRLDRPSSFDTVEEPRDLGGALRALAQPSRLVIVDCLTLWLTNMLMPLVGQDACTHAQADAMEGAAPIDWPEARQNLLSALRVCREQGACVVLVSNEIGWGVVPMGAQVRHFVDELGRLNQDVAQCCDALTLMAAGQAFTRAVERWA